MAKKQGDVPAENRPRQANGKQPADGADDRAGQRAQIVFTSADGLRHVRAEHVFTDERDKCNAVMAENAWLSAGGRAGFNGRA